MHPSNSLVHVFSGGVNLPAKFDEIGARMSMDRLISCSARVVARLNLGLMVVGACFLALLMVGTSIGVMSRYVFNSPLQGTKQISEYVLIWLCFLSVGWVLTTKGHISITVLEGILTRTKDRTRKYRIFISVCCLCYIVSFLVLTAKDIWKAY